MSAVDRSTAPTVIVDAPDGSVALYAPTDQDPMWGAIVAEAGHSAVLVAWRRHRSGPSFYRCAEHGAGNRWDHCKHTRAAILARREHERGTRP